MSTWPRSLGVTSNSYDKIDSLTYGYIVCILTVKLIISEFCVVETADEFSSSDSSRRKVESISSGVFLDRGVSVLDQNGSSTIVSWEARFRWQTDEKADHKEAGRSWFLYDSHARGFKNAS